MYKRQILLLAPFGIGVVLGIFLIAKLITFLFEKYGVQTFCAILGLSLIHIYLQEPRPERRSIRKNLPPISRRR